MIQVGQAKHPATVIRLDSVFAHDDGLPCRRIGTTAQIVWAMQALALGKGYRVLRDMAWLQQLLPVARYLLRIDAKCGDHFVQADIPVLIGPR
jgi:hypothetical protein